MSGAGVRVSGGELKGTRLQVPPGVRPTAERVREALCSRWQMRFAGARMLDLFAGSGIVTFEAISRGAALAVCVEGDPRVASALERSATRLTPDGGVRVRRNRLPAGLAKLGEEEPFDLVFADPPYAFEAWEALLHALMGRVGPDGEVAIEHACRVGLPEAAADLERVASRRYGDSCLSFYRPTGTESPTD